MIGLPLFHAQLAALAGSVPPSADGATTLDGAPLRPPATRVELLDSAAPVGALPLLALAHAMPTLLYACTPNGLVAYINRHWLEYSGLDDAQRLFAGWQELVHPEDHARLIAQWQHTQNLLAEDLQETQLRLRHASGEFRWHLSRARLLRDEHGRPRMWVGSATDIEHQKRAEEALDRRERESRTWVDHAPDGITRLDGQLRHVYANQALPDAFDLTTARLVGHTAAEAGLPQRDVDALMALRDSEQRFLQFAQSSNDMFWFADLARDELLYVGPACERLCGVSPGALQAAPVEWLRAVEPGDRHRLPAPFYASAADAQGHEPVREYRLRRPDGSVLWIRDRRFHLQRAGGRVLRIGGIAEDITERKLRELEREDLLARERSARSEAEALASAKDEFLAVVSHELRSPLNAIRGWAHVLRKTLALSPAQQRPLDAIDRNVAAQARMVDDLLDTQRLLRGKVALERRLVPLPTLVDQAVELLRPCAIDKQLRLLVEHAADVQMVDADPQRLRQVLVNLLSNAVKFTPPDGEVRVRTLRHGRERVAVEISDTGIGLEPAQAARVFEPFRLTAGSSSTRPQGGLGLGLGLARQLVELHGGRLAAHSEGLERGATFTVELPAAPPGDPWAQPPLSASLVLPQPLAGRRIAVVDDNPEWRQILELLLREEAVDAVFFATAEEGFAYLRNVPPARRPEVLISDIAMPGEDGYSLIRRLRALHRERGERPLPAVALTAFTSANERARALAAGFDAHLGKPIDPDQLRAALSQLLHDPAAIAAAEQCAP